jgi:hypothetical protein
VRSRCRFGPEREFQGEKTIAAEAQQQQHILAALKNETLFIKVIYGWNFELMFACIPIHILVV